MKELNNSINNSISLRPTRIGTLLPLIINVIRQLVKGNANSFTRNNKLSLLTILNHFQGIGNLVGSFFSCMPFTASLSRSLIQQTVGGRTQLASLISCGILVSVLLWIGPFFEPLPRVIEIKNLLKKKKKEEEVERLLNK